MKYAVLPIERFELDYALKIGDFYFIPSELKSENGEVEYDKSMSDEDRIKEKKVLLLAWEFYKLWDY